MNRIHLFVAKNKTLVLTVYWATILLIVAIVLKQIFPRMLNFGDKDITIYSSSTIFFYGEDGSVTGGGNLGQYNVTGGGSGGCCKSSELRGYRGKPDGEIVVDWQAFNRKTEDSKFYYAYHPNPEIDIPPKGKYHDTYIIFYSFA